MCVHVRVYSGAHVCAHVYGGLRFTIGIVLQVLAIWVFDI